MTNFDFLKQDNQFDTFSDVAITAERILHIDPASSIIACRRTSRQIKICCAEGT